MVTAVALTPAQESIVDARGARIVHAPAGTDLARWLGSHHVTAAVVRPDRAVMTGGRDITALCHALPTLRSQRPSETSDRAAVTHHE
jgi:3-(3-hydroxy-phenyl)propionate hydroxylase